MSHYLHARGSRAVLCILVQAARELLTLDDKDPKRLFEGKPVGRLVWSMVK